MRSKNKAREAIFAQRAMGSASAIGKNRPVNIATRGIRQSNPGRKNQPKGK